MEENKAVVPLGRQITQDTLQVAQAIAPLAKAYGLREEHATLAMLKGHELGFGLISSLDLIYVIKSGQGLRPSVSAQGMNAVIQRAGVLEEFIVTDMADADGPVGCTVRMKRKDNGTTYEATFTLKDAERAELLNKTNWQHWPAEMCRARAISICARVTCPDVLAGLYLADELGAETDIKGIPVIGQPSRGPIPVKEILDDGTGVIEGEFINGVVSPQPPTPKIPTLGELTAQYGVDWVMAACNGVLPKSDVEIVALAQKLAEVRSDA